MCLYPVFLPKQGWHTKDGIHVNQGSYVPCGKCVECCKHRQDEWFTRFMCEKMYQTHLNPRSYTCFFTLTYAPEHLPPDRETSITHIQTFRKNLNRYAKLKRFFFIQEFGDNFNRVHFHGLVFGCDYSLKLLRKLFDKCWAKGRSNVEIVRGDGAFRYVGFYVLKQFNNFNNDWTPYFSCSKRPALGSAFISSHLRDVLSNRCDIGFRSPSSGFFVEPRSWKERLRTPQGVAERKTYLIRFQGKQPERDFYQKRMVERAFEEKHQKYLRKKRKNDYIFQYLQDNTVVQYLTEEDIKLLKI